MSMPRGGIRDPEKRQRAERLAATFDAHDNKCLRRWVLGRTSLADLPPAVRQFAMLCRRTGSTADATSG